MEDFLKRISMEESFELDEIQEKVLSACTTVHMSTTGPCSDKNNTTVKSK